jgi:hypothetical protein
VFLEGPNDPAKFIQMDDDDDDVFVSGDTEPTTPLSDLSPKQRSKSLSALGLHEPRSPKKVGPRLFFRVHFT